MRFLFEILFLVILPIVSKQYEFIKSTHKMLCISLHLPYTPCESILLYNKRKQLVKIYVSVPCGLEQSFEL